MKYTKPTQLSDPHRDWEDNPEILAEIIATSDADLTELDYQRIFQAGLPAGTYEESAYYVEKCFHNIGSGVDIKRDRCPMGFFWWLDHNKSRLEADRLWPEILTLTESALWQLLNHFELHNLTEKECEEHRIRFEFSVYPCNANTVQSLVDEMITYEPFVPILDRIIDTLINSERLDHARWFIQLAWHSGNEYPAENDTTDNFLNNPRIRARKIQLYEKLNHPTLYEKMFSRCIAQRPETYPSKYQQLIS